MNETAIFVRVCGIIGRRLALRKKRAAMLAVCLFLVPVLAQSAEHSATLALVRGSRLMLPIEINGHRVNALLDSAAEVTLVDPAFAKALKLARGKSETGRGSGEKAFAAELVDGVTLKAAGVTLRNQTIAITDLSDVGERLLGHRLDAILGREIFDAARLAVDIDGQRIAVVPRDREPRGARLELVGEHGVETVPVTVESRGPVRATFDLGNGSRVMVSRDFARRMHLLDDGRKVFNESGGGLGGATQRQVVTLRTLDLAGHRFDNIEAAVDPQDSASDVNVGVSILRHFRITTDFAQRAVWLETVTSAR